MHPESFFVKERNQPMQEHPPPRNCWIKSVPVLRLPKGRHPPQTLFLPHQAGLRRLDQTLLLVPRRAPPV